MRIYYCRDIRPAGGGAGIKFYFIGDYDFGGDSYFLLPKPEKSGRSSSGSRLDGGKYLLVPGSAPFVVTAVGLGAIAGFYADVVAAGVVLFSVVIRYMIRKCF